MKHIKKFENKNTPYEITIIIFEPNGENYYMALYVDGLLKESGDYSSHIDEWIDGFIYGIRHTGKSLIYDKKSNIYCENEELNKSIVENGGSVPETLEEYEMIINGKNMGLL